jgi:crossover junction endodeoxyribonuclease RuvC
VAASLRILGIDPGSQCCGYGLVDLDGPRPEGLRYVECGVVQVGRHTAFAARLYEIAAGLRELIRDLAPAEVAVESVFLHANVQSALRLGHARGVALLCAAEAGLAVAEYSPARVKKAVTGRGRAGKAQIQEMVRVLMRLRTAPRPDAADALAVAICHAYACRVRPLTERALAAGSRA